jgi:hypothetical protein
VSLYLTFIRPSLIHIKLCSARTLPVRYIGSLYAVGYIAIVAMAKDFTRKPKMHSRNAHTIGDVQDDSLGGFVEFLCD